MSNALAIATVTAALGQIALRAAKSAVPGAGLATGRPEEAASNGSHHRVHVYLYQVNPNGALRNLDLPTRSGDGMTVARPSAALDLHYLIAFYGDPSELEGERMLGAVVRDLHAHPLLSRDDIQTAITGNSILSSSDLVDAFERVRFTPLSLSLEELSKLWSVFFQTRHAVSVAYQAAVVTIEPDLAYRSSLPVLRRGVDDRGVTTILGPFASIAAVRFGLAGDETLSPPPPAFPGAQLGLTLFVSGINLGGVTSLRFVHPRLQAAKVLPVPTANRTANSLIVTLPNDAAAQTDFAAGIYSLTGMLPPVAGLDHTTNAIPMALAPRITNIQPNPSTPDSQGTVTVQVTCQPKVLPAQRAVLLFSDRETLANSRPDNSPATDTLSFAISNASTVTDALVRLRVDGVDSMPFIRIGTPPALTFDPAQRASIT
jgi:hypothetical protein